MLPNPFLVSILITSSTMLMVLEPGLLATLNALADKCEMKLKLLGFEEHWAQAPHITTHDQPGGGLYGENSRTNKSLLPMMILNYVNNSRVLDTRFKRVRFALRLKLR